VLSNLQALDSKEFAADELGRSEAVGHPDLDRINVMGGSIAIGHPFGATGGRVTLTLLNEMARRDVEFGLITGVRGGRAGVRDGGGAAVVRGAGWGLSMRDADGRRGCPLAVYVNGHRVERVQRPGSELGLDDLVSARSLSGLEVHAGPDGPVRLTSDCGALLMWVADTWEASDTFRGRIIAVVEGPRADTVTSVTLHPGGEEGVEEEGRYVFSVLPGAYSLTFSTEAGALGVQPARVYARHDSRVSLSVHERFRER
jgi:hypothetical protein